MENHTLETEGAKMHTSFLFHAKLRLIRPKKFLGWTSLVLLGSLILAEPVSAQPAWSGSVIATGAYREQIKSMPIELRPDRPFHFYGNTVRRIYRLRTAVSEARLAPMPSPVPPMQIRVPRPIAPIRRPILTPVPRPIVPGRRGMFYENGLGY